MGARTSDNSFKDNIGYAIRARSFLGFKVTEEFMYSGFSDGQRANMTVTSVTKPGNKGQVFPCKNRLEFTSENACLFN